MFGKAKIKNCFKEEKESITRLTNEDISSVTGGVIFDKDTYYLVVNTSGMGFVMSRVRYGGTGQLTKDAAIQKALLLDAIDYSLTT